MTIIMKAVKIISFGIFLILHLALSQDSESEGWRFGMNCENGVCFRESDDGPCMDEYNDRPRLFRWEPIRVSNYSLSFCFFRWLSDQLPNQFLWRFVNLNNFKGNNFPPLLKATYTWISKDSLIWFSLEGKQVLNYRFWSYRISLWH